MKMKIAAILATLLAAVAAVAMIVFLKDAVTRQDSLLLDRDTARGLFLAACALAVFCGVILLTFLVAVGQESMRAREAEKQLEEARFRLDDVESREAEQSMQLEELTRKVRALEAEKRLAAPQWEQAAAAARGPVHSGRQTPDRGVRAAPPARLPGLEEFRRKHPGPRAGEKEAAKAAVPKPVFEFPEARPTGDETTPPGPVSLLLPAGPPAAIEPPLAPETTREPPGLPSIPRPASAFSPVAPAPPAASAPGLPPAVQPTLEFPWDRAGGQRAADAAFRPPLDQSAFDRALGGIGHKLLLAPPQPPAPSDWGKSEAATAEQAALPPSPKPAFSALEPANSTLARVIPEAPEVPMITPAELEREVREREEKRAPQIQAGPAPKPAASEHMEHLWKFGAEAVPPKAALERETKRLPSPPPRPASEVRAEQERVRSARLREVPHDRKDILAQGWQIRTVDLQKDLGALTKLYNEAAVGLYRAHPLSEAALKERLLGDPKRGGGPEIEVGGSFAAHRDDSFIGAALSAIPPEGGVIEDWMTNAAVLFGLFVHPAYRRRGVGTSLLRRVESYYYGRNRRNLIAGGLETMSFFVPGVDLADVSTGAFFEARGFAEARRTCHMEAVVGRYLPPESLVRRLEAQETAGYVFARGGTHDADQYELFLRRLGEQSPEYGVRTFLERADLFIFAKVQEQIVAAIDVERPDAAGYSGIGLVVMLPEYRGRGLGSVLLMKAHELWLRIGARVASIWTFPDAAGFYERAGFKLVKTWRIFHKPLRES